MDEEVAHMPVISLAAGKGKAPERAVAQELGDSFRNFGFAMITDHGLDTDLVARGWALTQALFALPDEVKRKGHDPAIAGARGYTPFKTEIAKGADQHDLKEFWHVGRMLDPGHPLRTSMPDNIWPDGIENFAETFAALYDAFDAVGARILSAVARYLGLQPDWFDGAIADGNSVLRLLHYPPIEGDTAGAIRAGAHEDINLITLLLGAEEAGLEILRPDGSWAAVSPPPGGLAVNVGDMLQRMTNHVLPSTTHRVVNPAGKGALRSRYSMPFFLHLRNDFEIATLPGCITAENPNRYSEPILADDYLRERLIEIGLLKV